MASTHQPAFRGHAKQLESDPRKPRSGNLLTLGGLFTSFLVFVSASCCVLPMIFVSVGLGGVWLAYLGTLFDYRYVLMGAAILFVGAGWIVFLARRSRTRDCDSGQCSQPSKSGRTVIGLSLATVFILGATFILVYQDTVTRFVFQNRSLWS
jgi:mercuric ion transport protein